MISQQAKALCYCLKRFKAKEKIDFINPKRSRKRKVPVFPASTFKSSQLLICNRLVMTISPANVGTVDHVVYFHGGGYAIEASAGHFQLMKRLIKLSKCSVTYVDYPLAPEHKAEDTLSMCLKAYEALIETYPRHSFILMGDSAGAGLALALAMRIRDEGLKGPRKSILFSPWLDIALTNGKIPDHEGRDHLLSAAALRGIGEIYRGNMEAGHYSVSPIYGDLKALGDIAVFYGTEELFYPDCRAFCENHSGSAGQVRSYVYEGMPHDWVLFPLPESDRALQEAVAFMGER